MPEGAKPDSSKPTDIKQKATWHRRAQEYKCIVACTVSIQITNKALFETTAFRNLVASAITMAASRCATQSYTAVHRLKQGVFIQHSIPSRSPVAQHLSSSLLTNACSCSRGKNIVATAVLSERDRSVSHSTRTYAKSRPPHCNCCSCNCCCCCCCNGFCTCCCCVTCIHREQFET
jgi:hypothetical protein